VELDAGALTETDQEGLRHPASGATSREDPDSIAASPANPAVAHRAPPSSEDGLAGPRRGSRASDTEPAVSIEDEQASIISMTDRRRALLTAALGFLELPPRAPALRLLHWWLDSWMGVGLITVGVERLGYRLSLSHIAEGEWRA
jgi:hypothetical protein